MSSLATSNRRFTSPPQGAYAPRSGLPAPYGLGFALFLVLNSVLFVRPAEIVPALLGLEIYLVCILACMLFSFPAILEQLLPRSLETRPITVFVLGLLLAVVLSHLSHFRFAEAIRDGWDFFKMILYFLLLVGLVSTPGRLRAFLLCFVLFAAVVAGLAVLQYHEIIKLPNLNPTKDNMANAATGQETVIYRLKGTGPFQDPNDLSILMVICILQTLYWLTDRRSGLLRLVMLGPLLLFAYALARTQSRGGMLALLAGLGVFMRMRFGWVQSLLIGAVLMPGLLLVFAGRQTNLSTASGTGQERIQIWSDGLVLFREAPLFGVGRDEIGKSIGHVAHNSYLQAFVELGLLGGFFYVSAFALALESFYRLSAGGRCILDPELRRLYPYLFGMITAYAVGMMSLTLNFIIATYVMLGLAIVYRRMTITSPPAPALRCDAALIVRLGGLSIAVLIGFSLFVRIFLVR
ncbi:MAG TPA: O-antigen ligase family protein [Gemmataceae bacterium]|nr:O-antigen ligase family protein [Gemmataceae bacterium]